MSVKNIANFELSLYRYSNSNECWKEVAANLKLDDGWALAEINGQGCYLKDYDFLNRQQEALYFLNYLQLKYDQIAVDFRIIILKMNHLMFTIGSY